MDFLIDIINKYVPKCEQEENDKKLMLKYISIFDDCLTRNNEMCHFTASSFIVNKEKTKCLMVYHNIYKSWSWTGGHADGDSDLFRVSKKETMEETGIKNLKLLQDEPISLQILTVDPHFKRGRFVSSHVHLDLCYLFESDINDDIRIKDDENSGVRWLDLDKINDFVTEEKMKVIYKKIINSIK